ncbi:MAG: NrtA/SsuA/CpmA family ABC transporter substrate-binding protein [Hyphomicrobiaceae bacterium]|nr:NrtA/SsuA/CpmA family ABC transporter substrate-binding protein [Hyphomicrobiaceae bacterium]
MRHVIAALAAGLSLISAQTSASAAEKVRLAQNLSPISATVIIAKQKGFFAKHGLDVEVSNFTSGKKCLDTVLGGGADIATTAEAPTTAAAMSKQPIAFLARMEYSDLKTLVAADAKIGGPADLKGKKIGYTAGTGGEVYTMTLLKKAGLKPTDVSLTNLPPQGMVAAMAAGSIDAFNTWEPHISNGLKVLGGKAKLIDTKGVYSETFNIVVMQDWLAKNPATADKFLSAAIEAEGWMKANKTEAIKAVAEAVSMKEDELSAIWSEYVFDLVLDDKQLAVLKAHAEWRLESGNHPPNATMPDFSKVIFADPLRRVAKDRVKFSGL